VEEEAENKEEQEQQETGEELLPPNYNFVILLHIVMT
jgi:hypothetical protein